ncbi:MAG: diguanylate cyclase [Rhodoferax sp.]|nr:diguanylate cyclase [Rhodoferax sp.]MDP3653442.1 diguanylate cyclase [Rhodoferax sp.]
MGIRLKILLVFGLCFGLMAGATLWLLRQSVNASYQTIERRELVAHMGRVLQGLESVLAGLSSQTRDWAEWTDLYDYASNPRAHGAWAQANLLPQSLESANLSLILLLDAKGAVLAQVAPPGAALNMVSATEGGAIPMGRFKSQGRTPRCGLVATTLDLMAVCWARITRSDFSGAQVGTVVMGRLLTTDRQDKLRAQTGLPFEMRSALAAPEGLLHWPDVLEANDVGGRGFWTAHDSQQYHLYYSLLDAFGKDLGWITLSLPRDVYAQGQHLFAQVRGQLVLILLGTALVLALALDGLLLGRLRRFSAQLVRVRQGAAWDARIDVRGRDELGLLAGEVNTMMGLIESQMAGLTTLSMTDTLTGLPNRRAFDERLRLEFARQQRTECALALLVLDVDYFKGYNDRYGHPAGDAALQAVAQVLRQACARASDLAARTGGEEFSVLLPETDAQGAQDIARHIQLLLQAQALTHENSAVAEVVTLSIGIAIAREESAQAFVQRADRALYQAKQQGRNRVCADDLPKPSGVE